MIFLDMEKFELIKKKYQEFYDKRILDGKNLIQSTEVGTWGTFSADIYFELFKQIELDKYSKFIDIGSGDGKAVLIASLFVESVGVEYDNEFYQKSLEIKKQVNMRCDFIHDDFNNIDLTKYDLIFINPDRGFHEFEEKLIKEMSGKLLVCNNIFLPRFLKKEKELMVGQVPFYLYVVDD